MNKDTNFNMHNQHLSKLYLHQGHDFIFNIYHAIVENRDAYFFTQTHRRNRVFFPVLIVCF